MKTMKMRIKMKKLIPVLLLVCILCAQLVFAASAADTAGSLHIDYCALSLENEVHLMYFVASDDAGVRLSIRDESGAQVADLAPVQHGYEYEGGSYAVFEFDGLAAKNMTDNYYAQAYIAESSDYGEVNKYSILQYAYNKLGKTGMATTNEALKEVLVEMLEYGAATQKYHGYKADRLATAEFVQVTLTGGTLNDGSEQGLYPVGTAITVSALETDAQGVPFLYWKNGKGEPVSTDCVATFVVSATDNYTAVYSVCEHQSVVDAAVPPTCTENGLTEGAHCSICGVTLIPQEPIAATGHAYNTANECTQCDLKIPCSPELVFALSSSSNGTSYIVEGVSNKALKQAIIPETYMGIPVTSIGRSAFKGCSSLESVTFSENSRLTSIGEYAFSQCSSLTSITIPSSVTSIGWHAFEGCSSLESVTFSENSQLTSIGNKAFSGCSSLTSITFSENNQLTSIGEYAFYNCSSLTSITIPSSVTSIGLYAFENCTGLTGITIPSSVTSIGGHAFEGCSSLTSIVVEEGNKVYHSAGNCLIKTAYKQLLRGCSTSVIPVDGSVTGIGKSAFSGCTGLTSITIPEGVTSIGDYAFFDCSSLESVTFSENSRLTSIGNGAFSGCSSLESVTFSENSQLTSIGDQAFYECSSLTSITIPEGVTSIGDYAFSDCSSLTSITIPSSVTSIGDSAFYYCNKLIQIENGVHYVDKWVVNCDTSVTEVVLRINTVGISDWAFYYCSKLTSITIPSSVTSIGEDAFNRCSSLTSITIPEGVTSIGIRAFSDCSSLESITFQGTEEQWNAITKGSEWDTYAGSDTMAGTYTLIFRPATE